MNFLHGLLTENVVLEWVIYVFLFKSQVCRLVLQFFACTKFRRWRMPSILGSIDCSISSFGQMRLPEACGSEFQACKLLSVSRGMLTVLGQAEPLSRTPPPLPHLGHSSPELIFALGGAGRDLEGRHKVLHLEECQKRATEENHKVGCGWKPPAALGRRRFWCCPEQVPKRGVRSGSGLFRFNVVQVLGLFQVLVP